MYLPIRIPPVSLIARSQAESLQSRPRPRPRISKPNSPSGSPCGQFTHCLPHSVAARLSTRLNDRNPRRRALFEYTQDQAQKAAARRTSRTPSGTPRRRALCRHSEAGKSGDQHPAPSSSSPFARPTRASSCSSHGPICASNSAFGNSFPKAANRNNRRAAKPTEADRNRRGIDHHARPGSPGRQKTLCNQRWRRGSRRVSAAASGDAGRLSSCTTISTCGDIWLNRRATSTLRVPTSARVAVCLQTFPADSLSPSNRAKCRTPPRTRSSARTEPSAPTPIRATLLVCTALGSPPRARSRVSLQFSVGR